MGTLRKLLITAYGAALTCTLNSTGFAQELRTAVAPGGGVYTRAATAEPAGALVFLTQNVDPDTVHCCQTPACMFPGGATTDNTWYRVFDLDGDHGLSGEVCVKKVEFAVETASGGPQDVEVRVSCLAGPLTNASFDAGLVASVIVSQDDTDLSFTTVTLDGCCDAGQSDMAIAVRSTDCTRTGCLHFVLGSNFQGQTKPGFIAAPDCGVSEPLKLDFVDFGDSHILISAFVDAGLDVPASSPLGLSLTVVLLLVASTLGPRLLRRPRRRA